MEAITYYSVFHPPVKQTAKLVTKTTLFVLQELLGGELEVLQLDETTCLLTNGQARAQSLPKNKLASQLWFDKHPVSGYGADFILGPVIHCENAQIAHLDHLHAEPKQVLTKEQKLQNELSRRKPTQQEILACSLENPEGCEMCGS